MQELLNNTQFNKMLNESKERPLLVCGDFNSPSHLDWTEKTKFALSAITNCPI